MARSTYTILGVLALLLLAGSVDARELTQGERAYARTLGKLLKLRPTAPKALSSRSGSRGVKVAFLGLSVSRLHFSSAKAARKFAIKRSKGKNPRQRISLRKQEVLVLRGARLSNRAFARRAIAAAWDASVSSPSVVQAARGLLAPLGGKLVGKKEPTLSSKPTLAPLPPHPRLKKAPPSTLNLRRGPQFKTDLLGSPNRAPVVARGRLANADGLDLRGSWETLGRGRIRFHFTGKTKVSNQYEVVFLDFDRPTPPLVGTLSGKRLTLRRASGGGATVTFIWSPSKAGGRFVRVGSPRGLLPSNTGAFWRSGRQTTKSPAAKG
ncbi:MAG: hypothetical protein JKY65_03465 [Planctomycetes bacterium]|nr:hypothetical protein [Planctomycetota bacterium]